jgi:hypothetical protein
LRLSLSSCDIPQMRHGRRLIRRPRTSRCIAFRSVGPGTDCGAGPSRKNGGSRSSTSSCDIHQMWDRRRLIRRPRTSRFIAVRSVGPGKDCGAGPSRGNGGFRSSPPSFDLLSDANRSRSDTYLQGQWGGGRSGQRRRHRSAPLELWATWRLDHGSGQLWRRLRRGENSGSGGRRCKCSSTAAGEWGHRYNRCPMTGMDTLQCQSVGTADHICPEGCFVPESWSRKYHRMTYGVSIVHWKV